MATALPPLPDGYFLRCFPNAAPAGYMDTETYLRAKRANEELSR